MIPLNHSVPSGHGRHVSRRGEIFSLLGALFSLFVISAAAFDGVVSAIRSESSADIRSLEKNLRKANFFVAPGTPLAEAVAINGAAERAEFYRKAVPVAAKAGSFTVRIGKKLKFKELTESRMRADAKGAKFLLKSPRTAPAGMLLLLEITRQVRENADFLAANH